MVTEILGFLIIIGAIIVLAAKYLTNKNYQPDNREIDVAATNLKKELERSGNEIINRMESHVNRLEKLLAEAENKNLQLTKTLAEYEAAIKKLESSAQRASEESKRLDAQEFSRLLEQSMQREEQQAVRQSQVPGEMAISDRMTASESSSESYAEEVAPAAKQAENLEKAMANEAVPEKAVNNKNDYDMMEVSMSAKIRGLLINGYSVEDIAKETGVGKGAIELVKQMNRHNMENF